MIQQGSCRFRVEGLGIIGVIVEIRYIVAIAIGLGFREEDVGLGMI